jgi:DNA-binding response OmpR family regulator
VARIFVIDDDEQLLRMVGLMLERGGHTTTLINNPMEGLERIKVDEPDLVVLDVMMPNMNGHDLTRQIRVTPGLEKLPILILTARSQEIDRTAALNSGANGYLSKPVTSQELMSQVDKLLVEEDGDQLPGQSLVLALYGMKGGTGRTTIAVNLAAALRRHTQKEICLLELGVSGGQAALYMRLETRSHWQDLIQADELDWATVKNHLTLHPSGLRLLASPPTPQPADLMPAETTTALLELLLENMTFVVVDMPAVVNPAFKAVMTMADMALHVIAPEIVAVKTAVNTNYALSQAGLKPRYKSHILNQTMPTAALSNKDIERALTARIAFHIEYDRNQPRAMSQGVPLALTSAKSPLPVVVQRMAEVLWQRVKAPK